MGVDGDKSGPFVDRVVNGAVADVGGAPPAADTTVDGVGDGGSDAELRPTCVVVGEVNDEPGVVGTAGVVGTLLPVDAVLASGVGAVRPWVAVDVNPTDAAAAVLTETGISQRTPPNPAAHAHV